MYYVRMKFERANGLTDVQAITVHNESLPDSLIESISLLKAAMSEEEDFEKVVEYSDSVADLSHTLFSQFGEHYVQQVPVYHHLIGSGMSESISFSEDPISGEMQDQIESTIAEFVEEKISSLK